MTWVHTKAAVVLLAAGLTGVATAVVVKSAGKPTQVAAAKAPLALSAAPSVDQVAPTGDWQQEFNRIYRLESGEWVKRIPPPWIPERLAWYLATQGSQAQAIPAGPDMMVFHWDGKSTHQWGMSFGNTGSVSELLGFALRLKEYEYEVPAALMNQKLAGDWIIDQNAPMDKLIAAMEEIMNRTIKRKIHIQKQQLPREVIVARGKFVMHPLEKKKANELFLWADRPKRDAGGGGGGGTLHEFLETMGSRAQEQVIDETDSNGVKRLSWSHDNSSYINRNDKAREEKLTKVLNMVSQQTELTFTREQRPVDVWVGTEVK